MALESRLVGALPLLRQLCRDIGLAEVVDEMTQWDPTRCRLSPGRRIEAMGYVLVMACLTYSICERRGRRSLAERQETIELPGKRQSAAPTSTDVGRGYGRPHQRGSVATGGAQITAHLHGPPATPCRLRPLGLCRPRPVANGAICPRLARGPCPRHRSTTEGDVRPWLASLCGRQAPEPAGWMPAGGAEATTPASHQPGLRKPSGAPLAPHDETPYVNPPRRS